MTLFDTPLVGLYPSVAEIGLRKPAFADATCGVDAPELFCASAGCGTPQTCNSTCTYPPLQAGQALLALPPASMTNNGVSVSAGGVATFALGAYLVTQQPASISGQGFAVTASIAPQQGAAGYVAQSPCLSLS